jgi:hypothetical protein
MNNTLADKPRLFPLVLILIGTTILALPAAYGTFILLADTFSSSRSNWSLNFLILIPLAGFMLFAGYILTAIRQNHKVILWLGSMLYNLGLSGAYAYFIFGDGNLSIFAFLPVWTLFVAGVSAYYLKHSLRPKQIILP